MLGTSPGVSDERTSESVNPAAQDQPAEGGDVPESGPGAERASDSGSPAPAAQPPGTDTPTGTDPDAKYEQPGYEDKSFGQAVNQDQELVDDLVEETGGDLKTAAERFEEESAGSPARQRQQGRDDQAS